MARTDNTEQRRTLLLVTILAFAAVFLIFRFWHFPPPQIGVDEDVFKTVDALFTAVNSKDVKQLDECANRLAEYQTAGTLNSKPAEFLKSIIVQARSGEWEKSAKRLYEFMYYQKRQKS